MAGAAPVNAYLSLSDAQKPETLTQASSKQEKEEDTERSRQRGVETDNAKGVTYEHHCNSRRLKS